MCVCACVCVHVCVCVPSLDRFNICHGVYVCVPSVCIEDQSNGDKHNVCTLYGTCGYIHMYLRAVNREPATWELHMHEESPKEYSYLHNNASTCMCKCVHSCKSTLCNNSVRNKNPKSLQVVQA